MKASILLMVVGAILLAGCDVEICSKHLWDERKLLIDWLCKSGPPPLTHDGDGKLYVIYYENCVRCKQ